jgi:hypothetical protein
MGGFATPNGISKPSPFQTFMGWIGVVASRRKKTGPSHEKQSSMLLGSMRRQLEGYSSRYCE